MHHGRWPWAIFLIGMPFLAANESVAVGGKALVLTCIFLSWVEHLTLPKSPVNQSKVYKIRIQFGVDILASVLTAYAAVATNFELDKVKKEHTNALFSAVILLAASSLYTLSREHSSTVFRAFAYTVGMCISGLLAVIHLKELVHLTSGNPGPQYSVANTTTTKCTQPQHHVKGFLFDATEYSDTCPTLVWEHVRLNVLFACQLYVLITLTTGLQQYNGKLAITYRYVPGALAIVECITLSVAAAIQFDVIAGCNQVGNGVAIMVCVSQSFYIIRLFSYLYVHPTPDKQPGLAMRLVQKYHNTHDAYSYVSSYKLKF